VLLPAPVRRVAIPTVLALAASLLTTGVEATALAGPAPAAAPVAAAPEPVSERPDATSAMVTARAQGSRVEDLSRRSEFGQVFANPDGTWTAELESDPVRVRDERGVWHPIDTTLVEADGVLRPRYAAAQVRLSAGGDRTFASVTETGRELEWRWPTDLPQPIIEGDTATYPAAAPGGGDLVVQATPGGFSHSIVLHEPPAGPVEFSVPVATDGAKLAETPEGGLEITTPEGEKLVSAPAPLMWDAGENAAGEPEHVAPIETTVGETAGGTPALTLAPDPGFLEDPDTVYPVTLDPWFQVFTSGDTWVKSNEAAGHPSSQELVVGTDDSGASRSRSFVHFNGAGATWNGKHILDANLVMRNFSTISCTGAAVIVRRVTEAWDGDTMTWANQPGSVLSNYAAFAPAFGNTGCPGNAATWELGPMVQDWANGAPNHGIMVMANNETSTLGFRKYRSANYNGGGDPFRPRIDVTYNHYPATTSKAAVSPGNTGWATTTTPTLRATVADADGGLLRGKFDVWPTGGTGSVWSGTSAQIANGGTAEVSVPADELVPGTRYSVRTKAIDAAGAESKSWSGWTEFTVDTTPPGMAGVAADQVTEGEWTDTAPASNTFTLTGPADVASFTYQQDNGTARTLPADGQGAARLAWNPVAGSHTLSVKAVDKAGNAGAWRHFTFGVGGSLVAATSRVPRSTDTFPLSLSGPPGASGARLEWRYASEPAWNTIGQATNLDGSPWAGTVTAGEAGSVVEDLVWAATSEEVPDAAEPGTSLKAPALVETRACFTYPAAAEVCSAEQPLQLVPSAFGGTFPVTEAGPGEVALWTGEFATSATDVDVPGTGGGSLSVSRTYASFSGPRAPSAAVFGPGWTGSFDGADAGVAGMQLVDNTLTDGTLVLTDGADAPLVFAPAHDPDTGWATRTGEDLAAGDWVGVDEDTPFLGLTAQVTGAGAATRFVLSDDAGVVTTFRVTTPATATEAARFAPESVTEPGAGATTYTRDGQGRVTGILSPLPTGMTPADCTPAAWAAGCRAVEIDYATATTATAEEPGDVAGQVGAIRLRVHDAAQAGGAVKVMASYAYDAEGRLVAVTDGPTGLTTGYGYDTEGRLATVTPPGLTPFQLEYAGPDARLARVTRDRPAAAGGGTATLATVLYGLRPDSLTSGLPDLRADTALTGWGQETPATYGAAVFGPDRPVGTLDPAEVAEDDWASASLWFTDFRGRTLNTASYGAGDWQLTYTSYDEHGNVVRELDEGDIAAIRAGATTIEKAGTLTVYNTETTDPAAGPLATPTGTVVTDVYGPARVVRDAAGAAVERRPHTKTGYDQGSPNGGINPATGGGWAMPTTVTTQAVDADTLAPVGDPVSVERTEYGEAAGWLLGTPTRVTTVMGAGQADLVTETRYDEQGRVVEQRQPGSDGTDAGTRRTVYYTKDANPDHPACGGRAEWEGLVCRIQHAGAPTSGPDLPVQTTTGYTPFGLQPTEQVETADGATRTTTTVHDPAGRVQRSWTSLAGMAGAPAPGAEYAYDPATGLPTQRWATTATGARTGEPEVTGYDAWGRQTSYAPAGDPATTTVYDTAGRVATVTDPKGTSSYGYDGTDAAGKAERRGLPTTLTITRAGGPDLEFAGGYDADGALTVESLPGGLTRRTAYDAAGEQTGLSYSGRVTTVSDDGTTSTDDDGPWLAWTTEHDIAGRVAREWTPAAAAVTGGLESGTATGYARSYAYDRASRLTKVVDLAAAAGDAQYGEGELTGTACQTRDYGFDANGNRTSKTVTGANPDGSCATTGGTTRTWAYDSADRITGGYAYDAFGRATTIPADDTPAGASAGALTLGYYDTDEAKTITQDGTTTTTFTLDETGRRSTEAAGPTGGQATTTLTRHYTDDGDDPAWVDRNEAGVTSTTRYLGGLGGDLAATLTTGGPNPGVELAIVDPHGDTPTTITVPDAGGQAITIGAWVDTDEYGNPTVAAGADTVTEGIGYGWLGAHERATTDTGLILMGARLYNRTTGQFTSMDPVYGGNSTSYTYPQDPINVYDLTGQFGCWSWRCTKRKAWKTVEFFSVRGYVDAGRHAARGRWRQAGEEFRGEVLGEAAGAGAKNASKRWGHYGKRSKRSTAGRLAKASLRGGARLFGAPVTIGATVADYAHRPPRVRIKIRHPYRWKRDFDRFKSLWSN
jgi:RHS repeat-associated protein